MSTLRGYFASVFDMLDDLEKNLDIFLRKGVIESNNRIDKLHHQSNRYKSAPSVGTCLVTFVSVSIISTLFASIVRSTIRL